jgi:hypothetical protein
VLVEGSVQVDREHSPSRSLAASASELQAGYSGV